MYVSFSFLVRSDDDWDEVLTGADFNTDMMGGFCKATNGRLPMALAPEERFGDSQEIGGTIVYLASKAGAYCNGLVMLVDGGYLSNKPSTY